MAGVEGAGAAREAVLDAAEKHFIERGYAAVTLKDVAQELGLRQASLYYHVPGGKEDLFVEVMLRHLERTGQLLEQVADEGTRDLEARLVRVAQWMMQGPPLNVGRMLRSDLPKLTPENAEQVLQAFDRCVFSPLIRVFNEASLDRKLRPIRMEAAAGAFLSLVEAAREIHPYVISSSERAGRSGVPTGAQLASDIVDLLLHGVCEA